MKNFLLQTNGQASSQQSRHMWEQTKRSIPDVEGGNWPDFQRRLNPRLSDSRPSLVGKRRRLSKSWHRPDWNFPCTIDSSDVVCAIFSRNYVCYPSSQYSWLCKCALSILWCTVDSGDIVLCNLFLAQYGTPGRASVVDRSSTPESCPVLLSAQ